jgi:hypothetical protein
MTFVPETTISIGSLLCVALGIRPATGTRTQWQKKGKRSRDQLPVLHPRSRAGEGQTLFFDDVPTTWTYVSEDLFKTMSVPVLRGRSYRGGWTEFASAGDRKPIDGVQTLAWRRSDRKSGSNAMCPGLWPKIGLRLGVAGDTAQDGPKRSQLR